MALHAAPFPSLGLLLGDASLRLTVTAATLSLQGKEVRGELVTPVTVGTLLLVGKNVALLEGGNLRMFVDAGTLSLVGQSVNLIAAPDSLRLTVVAGTLALEGKAARLLPTFRQVNRGRGTPRTRRAVGTWA